jgi:hypothetical protein
MMQMAQYVFYMSTGYVNSGKEDVIEIDDEELEGMTDFEIDCYIWDNYYIVWAQEQGDMGFYKKE